MPETKIHFQYKQHPKNYKKFILRKNLVFCDVLAILLISTFVLIFIIFMLIIIRYAILIINIVFPLLLLLLIIIIFMIIIISKVSSAILLANVGLLLGGFALTNIDKVIMIKILREKKWSDDDDDDDNDDDDDGDDGDDDGEMLNMSQVKQLADLADSWLGGGGDGNVDAVTKVVPWSKLVSPISN